MRLALFDLDHTLIPFDSGMAWTQYLVKLGVLPAEAEARYLGFCHQYLAGTLDIHAMHRASLAPLAGSSAAQRAEWQQGFAEALAPRLPAESLALVRRHAQAGDVCAIVTATTRLVAEPLARLFGMPHLVCTEAVLAGEGPAGAAFGEIDGLPCFRAHKVTRVGQWLQQQGLGPGLQAAEASWFYSDSASDLPLLQAVTDAVAVNPDERLAQHAAAAGWPVMRLG